MQQHFRDSVPDNYEAPMSVAYAYGDPDRDRVTNALSFGQLHASVSGPEWEPAHEYRVQRVGGAARLQTDGGGCRLHPPDAATLLQ